MLNKNKLLILFIILFAIIVLYLSFRGNKLKNKLLSSDANEITSIELRPVIGSKTTLVRSSILVNDRDLINSISKHLNESEHWSPAHPKIKWDCILVLNKKDGCFGYFVTKTTNNGLLITIYSNDYWGWDFGEYRNDSLEPIFEELSRE